jgi:hypothetical protein
LKNVAVLDFEVGCFGRLKEVGCVLARNDTFFFVEKCGPERCFAWDLDVRDDGRFWEAHFCEGGWRGN